MFIGYYVRDWECFIELLGVKIGTIKREKFFLNEKTPIFALQAINSHYMKKYIFAFAMLLISSVSLFAQGEVAHLTGKIIKKQWSKTMQSYCAGGSDYYVLKAKNNKETILDLAILSPEMLAKRLNKKATLTGTYETHVPTNDDPMSQQPVNPPMCEIFIVKTIK